MISSILLDTNVLIDSVVNDRPQSEEASVLISKCGVQDYQGIISSSSLKDAYYVIRKHIPDEEARDVIEFFVDSLSVVPLDERCLREALHSDEPDFEDGIIRLAAEESGVDYIITRDKKAFKNSPVRALTAAEFIALNPA